MDVIETITFIVILILLVLAWRRMDKMEENYINVVKQVVLIGKAVKAQEDVLKAAEKLNCDCLDAVVRVQELVEKLLAEEDTDEHDS